MHNLRLSISKLWNGCLIFLLKDESRCSAAMTANRPAESFSQIKRTTLSTMNGFFQRVGRLFPGQGLREDYPEGLYPRQLAHVSNKTGIIEMFEALDYKALDMVSSFIGEIVEQLCGLDCASIRTRLLCMLTFSSLYIEREWDQDGLKGIYRIVQKHRWLQERSLQSFCKLAAVTDGNHEISLTWIRFRRPVVSRKRRIFVRGIVWCHI